MVTLISWEQRKRIITNNKKEPPPQPAAVADLVYALCALLLHVCGIAYIVVGSVPYSSYANHAWSSYPNNVGLFSVLVWHLLSTWWPRFHHMSMWYCSILLSCDDRVIIACTPIVMLSYSRTLICSDGHFVTWSSCHKTIFSCHQVITLSYDYVIRWPDSHVIIQSHDRMILLSHDSMLLTIIWSSVRITIWADYRIITLSYYQMAILGERLYHDSWKLLRLADDQVIVSSRADILKKEAYRNSGG